MFNFSIHSMEFLLSNIFKHIKLPNCLYDIISLLCQNCRGQFFFICKFIGALPALFFFIILLLIRHSNHIQSYVTGQGNLLIVASQEKEHFSEIDKCCILYFQGVCQFLSFSLKERVYKLILIKMHCSIKCSSGLISFPQKAKTIKWTEETLKHF